MGQDAGGRKKGGISKVRGRNGGGKGERGARGQGKLRCAGRGVREEGAPWGWQSCSEVNIPDFDLL